MENLLLNSTKIDRCQKLLGMRQEKRHEYHKRNYVKK